MSNWKVWKLDTPYVQAHGDIIATIDAICFGAYKPEQPRPDADKPGHWQIWMVPIETVDGIRTEPAVPGLEFTITDFGTIADEFTTLSDSPMGGADTLREHMASFFAYLYSTGRIPAGTIEDY